MIVKQSELSMHQFPSNQLAPLQLSAELLVNLIHTVCNHGTKAHSIVFFFLLMQDGQKEKTEIVTPGTRIGSTISYTPGKGTHVRHEHIYASVVGRVNLVSVGGEKTAQVIEVQQSDCLIVPRAGDQIVARVVKIAQQFARVEILCVGQRVLNTSYPGMIRVQDVRQSESDKLVMSDCFRPGDLLRAEVISLGDQRSYFLSTAKNELGVTFARSASGGVMVPVSWQEMQCMKTGVREFRKVAKV